MVQILSVLRYFSILQDKKLRSTKEKSNIYKNKMQLKVPRIPKFIDRFSKKFVFFPGNFFQKWTLISLFVGVICQYWFLAVCIFWYHTSLVQVLHSTKRDLVVGWAILRRWRGAWIQKRFEWMYLVLKCTFQKRKIHCSHWFVLSPW